MNLKIFLNRLFFYGIFITYFTFLNIIITFLVPISFSRATIIASEKIKWVSPDNWPNYIDKNGKGLYADILSSVFEKDKYELIREVAPWKRALSDVLKGTADVTGAQAFDSRYSVPKQAVLADWEVLVVRQTTKVDTAVEFLRTHKGVWVQGYTNGYQTLHKNLLRGSEVKNRKQALRMLVSGRADYYLDNRIQADLTIKSVSPGQNKFEIVPYFCTSIYFLFVRSERGRRLRNYYDHRIDQLSESGILAEIYRTWGFELPRNDASCNHPPDPLLQKSK